MEKGKTYILSAPEDLAIRARHEEKHELRTNFARDRDRILHSRAFRRLSGKTQIFKANLETDTRTRLTHTLEVSQLARTVSKALHLDQDLTEAIALGHDLGHTPFGHVGERALNLIMNGCDRFSSCIFQDEEKGFKHNLQSLRVVQDLEYSYGDEFGLNLTNFTRFGILNHTKSDWSSLLRDKDGIKICINYDLINKKCLMHLKDFPCPNPKISVKVYDKYVNDLMLKNGEFAWSFESFIVKMCDEIAQRNHDLLDGLEMNLISEIEILEKVEKLFIDYSGKAGKMKLDSIRSKLGSESFSKNISKFVINVLVINLVDNSLVKLTEFINNKEIKNINDFKKKYLKFSINDVDNLICYDNEFDAKQLEFKIFLKDKILNSYPVQRMDGNGRFIIRNLFKAYLTNPQQLPDRTIIALYRIFDNERIKTVELASDPARLVSGLREDLEKKRNSSNEEFKKALLRVVCDFISGMTDSFAIKEYTEMYR